MPRSTLRYAFLVLTAALLGACAAPRVSTRAPSVALVRLSPAGYPDFLDSSDPFTLAHALEYSIDYYSKLPPKQYVLFGKEKFTVSEISASLSAFHEFLLSGPSAALIKKYVWERFDVYASTGHDGRGAVLFTGYYTPELPARAAYDEEFRYPLYYLPEDLVSADLGLFRDKCSGRKITGMVRSGRFVPYYTRKAIEEGALSGRGLEIAWCSDPVDVFFMQVQGSGVLSFPDGSRVHANYAGANGRPYRSIGKLLIDKGRADMAGMSLPWLKDYLHGHPDEAEDILDYNESYVFFTLDDKGPYGSLGEPVTPERTAATDSGMFPPGALAFIETEVPVFSDKNEITGWQAYSRFMVNQDTGGAIKGPGRVDIYFGSGEAAEARAGHMRREGRLYFLSPHIR